MPGVDTFRRDFVFKSFNRDAAVAEALDAVVQVSTLFEPMLERQGWQATGTTALGFVAPNLEALTWEQVLDFRDHPGAQEARQMLKDFEMYAAQQEATEARDREQIVGKQVTQALFDALNDRSMKLPRTLAEQAAKTGVSFIPVVGPFVGAIDLIETGVQKHQESHSGIAALMKLRKT
jgi:hypothetical protein